MPKQPFHGERLSTGFSRYCPHSMKRRSAASHTAKPFCSNYSSQRSRFSGALGLSEEPVAGTLQMSWRSNCRRETPIEREKRRDGDANAVDKPNER
jgi:hypothetical protein